MPEGTKEGFAKAGRWGQDTGEAPVGGASGSLGVTGQMWVYTGLGSPAGSLLVIQAAGTFLGLQEERRRWRGSVGESSCLQG